ncbi:MAG: hypothetical protein ACJ76Y_28805 [Thermoanaerobaculia bacterium]
MKKTLVLACCLALVAVAGFAQAPSQHRVTLADIMAPTTAPALTASQNQPLFLSNHRRGGVTEKATCTANCSSGTVTCTASSAGACFAQNVNCPTTQGYVTCDGATTYCPTACGSPQICTPGTTRYVWDGSTCCDLGGKYKEQQQCSADGTYWDYTGAVACGGPCGPRIP